MEERTSYSPYFLVVFFYLSFSIISFLLFSVYIISSLSPAFVFLSSFLLSFSPLLPCHLHLLFFSSSCSQPYARVKVKVNQMPRNLTHTSNLFLKVTREVGRQGEKEGRSERGRKEGMKVDRQRGRKE